MGINRNVAILILTVFGWVVFAVDCDVSRAASYKCLIGPEV